MTTYDKKIKSLQVFFQTNHQFIIIKCEVSHVVCQNDACRGENMLTSNIVDSIHSYLFTRVHSAK